MYGSERHGESLVLISDFHQDKNQCLLEDYKFVKLNQNKVGLIQTKLAIAIRYDKSINNQTSFIQDLRQK